MGKKAIYISGDQVDAIRHALSADQWAVLWIAAETGMRVGDAVAVCCEHLAFHALWFRAHKTGKAAYAPISAALYDYLAPFASSHNGYMFPSPRDPAKHITRQAVWARVKRACARAGIDPEGVSPHSFRKYFAVETYKAHGMKATQTALQHSHAATTEIYALSDFSTGNNAKMPLLREDIPLIVEMVSAAVLNRSRKIRPDEP